MIKTDRIEMLKSGKIGISLLKLSIPTIAGMLVMAVYNIVDTFFVGLLRDTAAIAATGIVFPIFQLIGAIGLTFGMGAASVISRRLGAKDEEGARRAASTAFYTALGIGVLFSIFGGIFVGPMLKLFGATESILDAAIVYGRIIIGGSIFQVINMCMNNTLRAEGAAGHSSVGMMLGAGLNIALDPLFIFVFGMGLAGAATATIIAQGIAALYLSSFYLRKRGVIRLKISEFTPTKAVFSGIMALGLPTLARQVLGSLSMGFLNNAASGFGDSAIAAVSVTFRIFMIVFMVLIGLGQGLQPLAGYNYGARAFDRTRQTLKVTIVWSVLISGVAALGFFVFASGIIRLFVPQNPRVVELGTFALRAVSIGVFPIAFAIISGGFFQALGEGRAAMLLALGQQGLFLIPLILILPPLMGVKGVFLAQPLGFTLAFTVALLLLRKVLGKMKTQEPQPEPA